MEDIRGFCERLAANGEALKARRDAELAMCGMKRPSRCALMPPDTEPSFPARRRHRAPQVFISAGEPSGDAFGARIMSELSASARPCLVEFVGVGGCATRSAPG